MVLNPIFETLEKWNRQEHEGVKLYDFGDSQTVMPIPHMESGSYLTSSICMLYIEGEGQLGQGMLFPRESDGIRDMGKGWKFLAVEIGYQWTPQQLIEALEKAKEKLLAAR